MGSRCATEPPKKSSFPAKRLHNATKIDPSNPFDPLYPDENFRLGGQTRELLRRCLLFRKRFDHPALQCRHLALRVS